MDCTAHGVITSQTQLRNFDFQWNNYQGKFLGGKRHQDYHTK